MSSIDTVLVTSRIHSEVADILRSRFKLIANDTENPWSPMELSARGRDADAILAFMTDSVDENLLAGCPRLKIVAGALKGWDNFDVTACTRRGVWLSVVTDLLTDSTAELAVGLMIGLARNIRQGDASIRSGAFTGWRPWFYGGSLIGAHVGIIGMGAVGRAIAQRLTGFGIELFYNDVQLLSAETETQLRARALDFDVLVASNDFIVVAAPLTNATHHLIDDTSLRKFRPGSYLVNVSRGSLVREASVRDALKTGALAGYAADVFEFEDWAIDGRPVGTDPQLLSMHERTLFTPHLGSAVKSVRRAIEMEAAMSIIDLAEGRSPRGAINCPPGA